METRRDSTLDAFHVAVVGAGYVGLVTGACLAHIGHRVTLVDVNEERVEALRRGEMPIYEPLLDSFVSKHAHRLQFTTELAPRVQDADVIFIAVDTPQGVDGSADLSNIAAVAWGIGRALAESDTSSRKHPLLVVNKSTVPVGSGDYVSMLIRDGIEEVSDEEVDFLVASNPEFLREGSAVYDSLFPDRIVVGTNSNEALAVLRKLYQPIIEQSFPTELVPQDPRPKVAVPFVSTDLVSAEMIKYAANAFLATKISFVNEMASICELTGADVGSVAYGIGLDERIGPRFLNAGIGWGGSCFPKDVAALRSVAREYDFEPLLLDATVAVNERQRKRVIQKLQHELHTLKGKRIALLGLAFKPNTDDLRQAPSLEVAARLNSLGAKVVGYDPVAGKAAAKLMPALRVVFDPYEALDGAHAAVIVTEWEELRELDLDRTASLMQKPPIILDARNTLNPREVMAAGIRYRGFGHG